MRKKVFKIFLFCVLIFSALSVKVFGAEMGAVAQMGDQSYVSLQEAVDGLQQGVPTMITLLKDTEESLLIPEGVTVTLDLNGKTITGNSGKAVIENNGNLTVTDRSKDHTGKILAENRKGICNNSVGELFVEDGEIDASKCALDCIGPAHISGGKILSSDTYAVCFYASNSTISGMPDIRSSGSSDGYGVYIQSNANHVTISGGNITSEKNHSIMVAGNFCEISGCSFTAKGDSMQAVNVSGINCVISGGKFESEGYAANFNSTAIDGKISGGEFRSAKLRAVNIYTSVTITGGYFEGNRSDKKYPLLSQNQIKYKVSGGYFSGDIDAAFLDQDCKMVKNTGSEGKTYPLKVIAPRYYATLSLNESIKVNFYVMLPETLSAKDVEKYKIVCSYDGQIGESLLSEIAPSKTEDNYNYFQITAAHTFAYEMIQPVDIKVYRDNVLQKEVHDYSVRQYCEDMAEKTQDERFAGLYRSVLDYGAAAQLYFNGKTYKTGSGTAVYNTSVNDLANKNLNPENLIAIQPEDIPERSITVQNRLPGISKISLSMILGSETAIKFYFTDIECNTVDDFNKKYDIKSGDKSMVAEEEGDHRFSVKTKGMGPAELIKDHTLTIMDKTKDKMMTVTWSAAALLYANRNRSGAEGNLYRALYGYISAANVIWPSVQNQATQ